MQKCSKLYGFSLKMSAKHRFLFYCYSKGRKCINQKKLNVKTLSLPYIKRTHQSYQLCLGHLGMLRTQTDSVFKVTRIIYIVRWRQKPITYLKMVSMLFQVFGHSSLWKALQWMFSSSLLYDSTGRYQRHAFSKLLADRVEIQVIKSARNCNPNSVCHFPLPFFWY